MEGIIDILQAVRKEQEGTLSILDSLMPGGPPGGVVKDPNGPLEMVLSLAEMVRDQAVYIQAQVARIQTAIQGDQDRANVSDERGRAETW